MDYKALLTQVQKTVASIDKSTDPRSTILSTAETIAKNFHQLGITGGRLYEWCDDMYELVHRFGEGTGELGVMVPRDYKPIELALENGVVVMEPNDPGVDPVLEQRLGARRFAAVSVGDEDFILSFNVTAEPSREDILFSLNLVRYAINSKLREERFESLIAEAQRIQQSILPQRVPNYPGYDIFGKTIAAEYVSGDFFDYIPISDTILGLAIADGSGHGLPAALVVRDIYMGLRMGVDRDFKIVRTMQKLNQIIHRSRLTTKFVSLFYGELESNGTFLYTNAGHNPPFIVRGEMIEPLKHGGTVLGPTPDASFNRGYVDMVPGSVLCMYTDGIVEAHNDDDEEFGLERLQQLVREHQEKPSVEIAQQIFNAVSEWASYAEDDRTVVIVRAV